MTIEGEAASVTDATEPSAGTDWQRLCALTDEEIHEAVLADPDVRATDEQFWRGARVVMPSKDGSDTVNGPASDDRAGKLRVEAVVEELPAQFNELCAEARGEGYGHLDRLAADWHAGIVRFDRDGEALLIAVLRGDLAGIGGLTIDPVMVGALRMRRFYTRVPYRRNGIGRLLAERLLARVRSLRQSITVNAAPGSERFWQALGFNREAHNGCTHVLRPGDERPR